MNEYEHVLVKKANQYIELGQYDLAEEIFKNYSGDVIDSLYFNYIDKLYFDKDFYRSYINYNILHHSQNIKNDPCPPYREYCKYLKKFDKYDKGKRLLVCGAMPLGDQIFFTRFLPLVLDITKNITVITLPRLVEHFTNAFPDVKFVENNSQIKAQDFDCVLFMPFINKFAFDKNNLPIKPLTPTAVTNDDKVKKLRSMPEVQGKTIIGFSWRSARNDHRDFNDIGSSKSLIIRQLLPFFDLPNTIFINLQHGDFVQELDTFKDNHNIKNIITLEDLDINSTTQHIFDYVDMCDYIVGPTNTLTLMAGALHKKTFALVPNKKSVGRLWMYHKITEDRKHTFFPTVRMYEQDEMFDWEPAIKLARNDLMDEIYGT